jgi:hypothetical protein
MHLWSPGKLSVLIAAVVLIGSIIGGYVGSQATFAGITAEQRTHKERLNLHSTQILEIRHDIGCIQADLSAGKERDTAMWELLKELRVNQIRQYRVSADNNRILKNGGNR